MRAVLIEEIGRPPVVRDVPEPEPAEGEALVEVSAAPLNPIDLSIATGRFYRPASGVPYVVGQEAVGRVRAAGGRLDGERVYVQTSGGLDGPGSLCERVAAPEDRLLALPDGADDALAACLGVAGLAAWLPLERRASPAPRRARPDPRGEWGCGSDRRPGGQAARGGIGGSGGAQPGGARPRSRAGRRRRRRTRASARPRRSPKPCATRPAAAWTWPSTCCGDPASRSPRTPRRRAVGSSTWGSRRGRRRRCSRRP